MGAVNVCSDFCNPSLPTQKRGKKPRHMVVTVQGPPASIYLRSKIYYFLAARAAYRDTIPGQRYSELARVNCFKDVPFPRIGLGRFRASVRRLHLCSGTLTRRMGLGVASPMRNQSCLISSQVGGAHSPARSVLIMLPALP